MAMKIRTTRPVDSRPLEIWPVTLEAVIVWLRLWTMLLPWLVFLVAFQRRLLADTGDLRLAVAFTGLLAFGTTSTTYASMFASHVHAGMALFAGFIVSNVSPEWGSRHVTVPA